MKMLQIGEMLCIKGSSIHTIIKKRSFTVININIIIVVVAVVEMY